MVISTNNNIKDLMAPKKTNDLTENTEIRLPIKYIYAGIIALFSVAASIIAGVWILANTINQFEFNNTSSHKDIIAILDNHIKYDSKIIENKVLRLENNFWSLQAMQDLYAFRQNWTNHAESTEAQRRELIKQIQQKYN
jgi:cell division septal protein FtsQ